MKRLKNFFLISILVFLTACGSSSNQNKYKNIQILADGYFSNCWVTSAAKCEIYQFQKGSSPKKVATLDGYMALAYRSGTSFLINYNPNTKKKITIPAKLFDDQGNLLSVPKILSNQGKSYQHSLHMTLEVDNKCQSSQTIVSHGFNWAKSNTAPRNCQAKIYSRKSNAVMLSNIKQIKKKNSLFEVFHNKSGKLAKFQISAQGEILGSGSKKAVSLDYWTSISYDVKTRKAKLVDKSGYNKKIGKNCQLFALHSNHPKNLESVIANCNQSYAIFSSRGNQRTLDTYKSIDPLVQDYVRYDKRPRAFLQAKQRDGKFALLVVTPGYTSEFRDFDSTQEIKNIMNSIRSASAVGGGRYSGISKFVKNNESYYISTHNTELLPEGDWIRGTGALAKYMINKTKVGKAEVSLLFNINRVPNPYRFSKGTITEPTTFTSVLPYKHNPSAAGYKLMNGGKENWYLVSAYQQDNGIVKYGIGGGGSQAVYNDVSIVKSNVRLKNNSKKIDPTGIAAKKQDGTYDTFYNLNFNLSPIFVGSAKTLKDASHNIRRVIERKDMALFEKERKEHYKSLFANLTHENNVKNYNLTTTKNFLKKCIKEVGASSCGSLQNRKDKLEEEIRKMGEQGTASLFTYKQIETGFSGFRRIHGAHQLKSMRSNTKRLKRWASGRR